MDNIIDLLRQRFATCLTDGTFKGYARKDPLETAALPSMTFPGGYPGTLRFRDVDYTSEERAAWVTSRHLNRALLLAVEYRKNPTPELREMTLALLSEWLHADYRNPNWWHNKIGVPRTLGAIFLLLREEMTEEMRESAFAILSRGSFGARPELISRWTGANLIWFSGITIIDALLRSDAVLLRQAVSVAAGETGVGDEGLQSDGSFFQHGHRLYSGGYGRSYVGELATLAYLFRGTPFQLPPTALWNLSRHILDGLRHMTQGMALDYAVTGREYTRPGMTAVGSLLPAYTLLCAVEEFPRREELCAYRDAILAGSPPVEGVRYFPEAAYLTLHIRGLFVSFKGTNSRLVDAEICNRENVIGYNLSYGTHTTVMRDGSEYNDIAPLWDYAKIPGTTAMEEDDAALLSRSDFSRRSIPGGDCGGAGFSDCGVCYSAVSHEGVSATVAAFASPYGMVLLGCDPTGSAVTTAEQCFAKGGFTVSPDGREVLHNQIVYRNLDSGTVWQPSITRRTGSWYRNSLSQPDTPVEGDLFCLTLARVNAHNRYAYAILPEGETGNITVLRNDREVQAISLPDGRVLAVFHAEATLPVGNATVYGSRGRVLLLPATGTAVH